MAEKRKTVTAAQVAKMKMLRGELTKVRCWMSGYHAGRGGNSTMGTALVSNIPGEGSLGLAIMLFDEITEDR